MKRYHFILPQFYVKAFFLFNLLCFFATFLQAQIPGFKPTGFFNEQELTIKDTWQNVTININAPEKLNPKGKTYVIFYPLPNGNTIEWTKGKKMTPDMDWHFDIQHIAAQMRYVRNLDKKNNYIIAYMMAGQKSWPAWKKATPDSIFLIKQIVDSISNLFAVFQPKIILNGHSGGGSFVFGYLDAVDEIPMNIECIAFLDSDYSYDENKHKNKLTNWLQQSKSHKLLVLAYNDSVVIYNGKPLVSATGGTWYRSRLMQRNLSETFHFYSKSDTAIIVHQSLNGRIKFVLKENPAGQIYHTEQVGRNGFILSLLSGTKFDSKKYFTYFGQRVYEQFITD